MVDRVFSQNDKDTAQWKRCEVDNPLMENKPIPSRVRHTCVAVGGRVYILGGGDTSEYTKDALILYHLGVYFFSSSSQLL